MKFFHLEIITFFPEIVFNLIICRVIYLVCVERKSSKKAKQHLHPPSPCDDKNMLWCGDVPSKLTNFQVLMEFLD